MSTRAPKIYSGAKGCSFPCEELPSEIYFYVTGELIVIAENCPSNVGTRV